MVLKIERPYLNMALINKLIYNNLNVCKMRLFK
jgi:hypothetical protein